jgi:hypothetical protein
LSTKSEPGLSGATALDSLLETSIVWRHQKSGQIADGLVQEVIPFHAHLAWAPHILFKHLPETVMPAQLPERSCLYVRVSLVVFMSAEIKH